MKMIKNQNAVQNRVQNEVQNEVQNRVYTICEQIMNFL